MLDLSFKDHCTIVGSLASDIRSIKDELTVKRTQVKDVPSTKMASLMSVDLLDFGLLNSF